jgi:hypothetical protein
VLGTSVPEASVDEYCDPSTREDNVGTPTFHRRERRSSHAIAKTSPVELSPQVHLRSGVHSGRLLQPLR